MNLETSTKKEKEEFVLKYIQASIRETIQFIDTAKDDTALNKWFHDFLKEKGNLTDDDILLVMMNPKKYQELFKTIRNTRFRGVFDAPATKKQVGDRETMYGALIVAICEKFGMSPRDFQEKYTFEEMNYIVESMIFLNNEQTEEGKALNDKKKFSEKYSDEYLIDKFFVTDWKQDA